MVAMPASLPEGPTRQNGRVSTFYDEIGGDETIRRIVARFYEGVAGDPVLRPLYPEQDLGPAEERFRLFLIQYWGGPTTYSDTRGHPRLRMRHAPYAVTPAAWDSAGSCTSGPRSTTWSMRGRLTPEQDAQFWDYVTHAAQFMVNTFDDGALAQVRQNASRGGRRGPGVTGRVLDHVPGLNRACGSDAQTDDPGRRPGPPATRDWTTSIEATAAVVGLARGDCLGQRIHRR